AISQSKTIVVFTNQMRSMISASRFGPSTTTAGGWALKFYASLRLQMWGAGKIEEGAERIGVHVNVRVVKNKVAPPFKEATFDVIYGKGIVRSRDLINTGEALGLISRSGSWYSFDGDRLGQGIGNSAQALEDDTELADRLEAAIREKAALGVTLPTTGDDDADEE
ncbi:MAG: DNA recombination/repair protein RecA, partial [Candidatus Bipolaricaulia bacterium]